MKAFLIDSENNVTAYASVAEAHSALNEGGIAFSSVLYGDLLDGSYDCVDRVVLNAYFSMGQSGGRLSHVVAAVVRFR